MTALASRLGPLLRDDGGRRNDGRAVHFRERGTALNDRGARRVRSHVCDRDRNDGGASHEGGDACPADREAELPKTGERESQEAPEPARAALSRRYVVCALELLAQAAASTEDKRLDGRQGQLQLLCDLRVRTSLDLPQEDDGALVWREAADRGGDLPRGRPVHIGEIGCDLPIERDLLGPPRKRLITAAHDVARDCDEPGTRLVGLLAPPDRPKGVHESDLRDVLGLVGISDVPQDRAVYVASVAPVEPLERGVAGQPLLK